MDRNQLIAAVIAFAIFVVAMVYAGQGNNQCKIKALDAGKTADDIVRICGK
jgi:hypothetical protein